MMNLGDNYVTGDNIYLRELQNFFFEVLGMMSITHYGAIGDGRTDNYGPLQVAIDDANRRGINYLYVPYGKFIYTGELINIGEIKFVGNPHSKIVNIRTGEEITIHQFGAPGYYIESYGDLANKPTINGNVINGDMTSLDLGLQAALIAGEGISIEDSVIATDGMQKKLTPGSNISIDEDGVISAFAGADTANRPAVMAKLSGQTVVSSIATVVPFDVTTYSSTGSNYFTLQNSKIVVGTGVTKVAISFNVQAYHAGVAGLRSINLMRSGTIISINKEELFPQFEASNYILDVQEGDEISIVYTGEVGDTIEASSFLTIEAIEVVTEIIEPFFTPISPTSWTDGEHSATATNTYGTWTITAGPVSNQMPYDLRNASDGNDSSTARLYGGTDNEGWIEFALPEGVSISPRTVKINSGGSYTASFKGYNGSSWVTLASITSSGGVFDGTKNISTDSFFTKFKYDGLKPAGSGGFNVYDIQITAGIVKH